MGKLAVSMTFAERFFFEASNYFHEAGAFGRCNFCRLDSAIDSDGGDVERPEGSTKQ